MTVSTDNPQELFDLVDTDDRVVGTVRRGDAHKDPALIHRSVQVLVFSHHGQLLLQKRSALKDLFPGYYCASASGHVDAGEDYETAARRELCEELGVEAQPRLLGKTLVRSASETEMTAVFVSVADGPFHFHPTETDGGQFVKLDEALALRGSDALPMTPALLAALATVEGLMQAGGLMRLLAAL